MEIQDENDQTVQYATAVRLERTVYGKSCFIINKDGLYTAHHPTTCGITCFILKISLGG